MCALNVYNMDYTDLSSFCSAVLWILAQVNIGYAQCLLPSIISEANQQGTARKQIPPPFYVLIAFNVHHQWEKGNPTRNPSFYLRFGCSSLTIVPWKFMGNNNKAIRNQIVAWTFFCLICATLCGRGACTYLWPVAQQHWSSRVFTMKTVDRRSKVLSVLCNIVGHTLISRGTTIPAHFFSISHA